MKKALFTLLLAVSTLFVANAQFEEFIPDYATPISTEMINWDENGIDQLTIVNLEIPQSVIVQSFLIVAPDPGDADLIISSFQSQRILESAFQPNPSQYFYVGDGNRWIERINDRVLLYKRAQF